MATYVLPTFNLPCDFWRLGNPVTNAPDVSENGNLSPGRLVGIDSQSDQFPGPQTGYMWLRLPTGTDVRDGKTSGGPDVCEAPSGSGWFYRVDWVDRIGAGFPNEHMFAALAKLNPANYPFAGGSGANPPPTPPGAPSLPLTFSTAAAIASFGFTFQMPQAGGVLVNALWLNQNTNLAITGAPNQNGPQITYAAGGVQVYQQAAMCQVPAGLITLVVKLATNAATQWAGLCSYVSLTGSGFNANQNAVGAGFNPNVAPNANPFGGPASNVSIVLSSVNQPGGFGGVGPFVARDTVNFNLAGANYKLDRWDILAPPNGPAAEAFNPLIGWAQWGYNVVWVQ